jgi:outer membrane protein TolC
MNMIRKISFLFLIIISIKSDAQRVLTIDEAIATALQNNYDILLAKNDSMAAAIDYSYRNAAFLPRVNGNIGTVWNTNGVKQVLADGTKRESNGLRSNNINAQLALNWTLFDGLKMFATRDKLEEFIKLGELSIKNQLVNTVATVVNNYYNIVRQKQQLKAILEQMDLSNERLKVAQYKLDIGVGTKPDVLQAKLDVNAQKASQLQQLALISELKEQLNQLMNVQQSTMYEVTDSIPINTLLSMGEIQSTMELNNPALKLAKKNIDIANLTLKERRAERFPTVSFNSAYNFNRTQNQAVINNFSTLFNRARGFNYGLTASIPILNNFVVRRNIKQAELDIRYQQLIYDNQRSLLNLSLINAYQDYEMQKRALALEEENIILARENINILFQVYKLNSTTLVQLKEAEKSLADAYNRLIAARYATKLAETELLRLRGDLVR